MCATRDEWACTKEREKNRHIVVATLAGGYTHRPHFPGHIKREGRLVFRLQLFGCNTRLGGLPFKTAQISHVDIFGFGQLIISYSRFERDSIR